MLASVIIEYSVKSLNKVFDYMIPNDMEDIIRVGHKVIIPFASKEVEGFVLKIHNSKDDNLEYKSIIRICDSDFYLNDELLKLGKYMSNTLLCNLISCYQVMLPKALKASIKTNINKKYETYVVLNEEVNISEYIELHKRRVKEIEIINYLRENENVLRSSLACSSLTNLIKNGIVLENKVVVNREVDFENVEFSIENISLFQIII